MVKNILGSLKKLFHPVPKVSMANKNLQYLYQIHLDLSQIRINFDAKQEEILEIKNRLESYLNISDISENIKKEIQLIYHTINDIFNKQNEVSQCKEKYEIYVKKTTEFYINKVLNQNNTLHIKNIIPNLLQTKANLIEKFNKLCDSDFSNFQKKITLSLMECDIKLECIYELYLKKIYELSGENITMKSGTSDILSTDILSTDKLSSDTLYSDTLSSLKIIPHHVVILSDKIYTEKNPFLLNILNKFIYRDCVNIIIYFLFINKILPKLHIYYSFYLCNIT